MTVLPVLVGGAGTAGAGAVPAPADVRPVPEESLVPGYPLPPVQPYQRGTPDQGMFPPEEGEPGPEPVPAPRDDGSRAQDEPATPGAGYAVPSALIEYVPAGEQIRTRAADAGPRKPGKPGKPGKSGKQRKARKAGKPGQTTAGKTRKTRKPRRLACSRRTGPYQRNIERYLRLRADGRQSRSDCRAIQRYQIRIGVYPPSGFAGPTTWKVMTLRWARKHPYRLRGCPAARGRVVCMDLRRQLLWVRNGKRIVFAPVPVRTGKPGYATRTGWNRVFRRVRHEHSRIYDAPMPFSQYFNGGQAIHGVYDDLYTTSGSHGCVNLTYRDAQRLWTRTRNGDRVYSWGRKPNP